MDVMKLLKLVKWPKSLLYVIVVLSIISACISLTLPILTRNLIDDLTNNSASLQEVLLLVGMFLLNGISGGVSFYLIKLLGSKIMYQLRLYIFDKIMRLPISYFDNHETGQTISRMTDDVENINDFITDNVSNLIAQVILIIGAIVMLFVLDWKFSLMIFLAIPIVLVVILPIGNLTYKVAMQKQDTLANFTGLITRVLSDIRLVKTYNAEQKEKGKANVSLKELFALSLKAAKIQSIVSPVVSSALILVLFTVVGYGVYRISTGSLTAGTFVAILFYMVQSMTPISGLSSFFNELKKTEGSTVHVSELLQLAKEHEQVGTKKELLASDMNISFENIHFSYNTEHDVLKDVNFTIPANKVTAIVGPSGSGKSTIFYLLERFYAPSNGVIAMNGINIHEFDLHQWRRHIGYVMQDNAIMNGTIEENLTYGLDRTYSQEELFNIAKASNCDEFITKLEDGYQTFVGERGVKLSGGQKQRLSIGRALFINPKLLLLDEATSSLDSESEALVQEAIHSLIQNRTTIIIAHRLSTIKNADQIIFLDNGVVTGIGTHDELMTNHEKYAYFVQTQSFD